MVDEGILDTVVASEVSDELNVCIGDAVNVLAVEARDEEDVKVVDGIFGTDVESEISEGVDV